MTLDVDKATGDLTRGPRIARRLLATSTQWITEKRCAEGHVLCRDGTEGPRQRGCGCCECLRTTARYAHCFGCRVDGCPCFVPLQPWGGAS